MRLGPADGWDFHVFKVPGAVQGGLLDLGKLEPRRNRWPATRNWRSPPDFTVKTLDGRGSQARRLQG